MVISLERGADLHMVQPMPLPLTVSCFTKVQIDFAFLVPAHLVGVCVCVRACMRVWCTVCWLSGAPESLHVSPEEQHQVIENGSVIIYTVDIMDKSGNPTTESKASVTCKVCV